MDFDSFNLKILKAKSIKNNLSEALQLVNPVSLFKFAPIKSVKNHGKYLKRKIIFNK